MTIQRLREAIAEKDREIYELRARLTEVQDKMPWINEACGDDLWRE